MLGNLNGWHLLILLVVILLLFGAAKLKVSFSLWSASEF